MNNNHTGYHNQLAETRTRWLSQPSNDSANSAVGLLVPHFKKTAPFDVNRSGRPKADEEFGHLFCQIL
ncbi:hypothetical protein [Limnobacter parvus]|uniref:Uncharacterized protein n=1 Tax=Limnobacter parvus TaxID=2939690 RepID=A0ABT1XDX6_9BURK|nr:hypothetical protein [Limnobacter parvus]MCR2745111.1 hypothetical protein [Limnobacter parvus]